VTGTLSGTPGAHPELDDPPADPFGLLREWVAAAETAGIPDTLAAALATVGVDGAPSVRFVALKEVTEAGVVFGTSTESPKGRDMSRDPRVALAVYWRDTMQQVRLTGRARPLADEASDRLFHARVRAAQAATIVSRQSEPLTSEPALAQQAAELERGTEELVRPAHWRAWLVTAQTVEFWVGSTGRLHRRLAYTRTADGWSARRLQP